MEVYKHGKYLENCLFTYDVDLVISTLFGLVSMKPNNVHQDKNFNSLCKLCDQQSWNFTGDCLINISHESDNLKGLGYTVIVTYKNFD